MSQSTVKASQPKSKLIAFIVAWIGLFVFNAMFTKTGSIVPVPIIAAFTLIISGALIKEQPQNKKIAITTSAIAAIFIIFVFISTMYMGVQFKNLFDIRASNEYIVTFYSLAFLSAGSFMTNGLTIFKTIQNYGTALLSIVINALIVGGVFFGVRALIETFIVVKVKYLFVPEVYESIYQLLQQ